jgi:hypothetical protein
MGGNLRVEVLCAGENILNDKDAFRSVVNLTVGDDNELLIEIDDDLGLLVDKAWDEVRITKVLAT